jgi:hypothetical protein
MKDLLEELKDLNIKIAVMEQQGGDEAKAFFDRHLADELIFHRANGKIEGKDEFMAGLTESGMERSLEGDISATQVKDRFIATLIVTTEPNSTNTRRFRNVRFFSHSNETFKLECWYNHEL